LIIALRDSTPGNRHISPKKSPGYRYASNRSGLAWRTATSPDTIRYKWPGFALSWITT